MPGVLVASALLLVLAVRTRRSFAWDDPMCALVLVAAGLMVVMCGSFAAGGRGWAALFLGVLTAPLAVVAVELARVPPPVRGRSGVDWERFDAERAAWALANPAPAPDGTEP